MSLNHGKASCEELMKDNSPQNRVLLWSPYGSAEHYNGPAKYTYRIYSKIADSLQVSLAHGFPDQPNVDFYTTQHFVHPLGNGRLTGLKFANKGKSWIKNHAHEFDLFHGVSGYQATVPVAYAAKKLGLPVLIFVSNENGGLASKGGIAGLLGIYRNRQKMAREFDGIIAMSSEIESELLSLGVRPQNIYRIPNFADTSIYFPVDTDVKQKFREELGLKDIPTVVFVGRLSPRKRPHLIIKAIHELQKKNIEAQAVFVGPYDAEDVYIEDMFNYVKTNGLERSLVFPGFTNEVDKWLKAADVFCLPSLNEGMPGALVEAMACGLPAVISPFSSANDLVSSDIAGKILPELATPSEIADAFRYYFGNEGQSKDFQQRGQFINQQYSLESVSKMYSNLIQRLIKGRPLRG